MIGLSQADIVGSKNGVVLPCGVKGTAQQGLCLVGSACSRGFPVLKVNMFCLVTTLKA